MSTLVYTHTEATSWLMAMSGQAVVFDGSTSLSNPGDFVHSKTLWTTDMASDPEQLVLAVGEGSSVAWRFYTTVGNNATAEARLWGYSKLEENVTEPPIEYVADYLCKLDLTSGAKGVALAADSAILPVCNFVDTIAVAEDRSLVPGVRVISHGDEAFAAVVLDGLGYLGYILQIKPATPTDTNWGALFRIF